MVGVGDRRGGQRQNGSFHHFWSAATMSNQHLPAELLDHVVDFLYGSRNALESCCLVSKSWIPRARKHIFADIKFTAGGLKLWKTMFPDPSTSPACYTKVLHLTHPLAVAAKDREGGWISTFNRVVHFELDAFNVQPSRSGLSLAPFRGFSPAIKSLRLVFDTFGSSQAFDLIYSFPLLEDLAVISFGIWIGSNDFDDQTTAILPSISPSFTGCLKLDLRTQASFVASQLLSLSNGLHFRKLHFTLNEQKDTSQITALVEECCFTLESLEVVCELFSMVISHRCPQWPLISVCRQRAIGVDRPLESHTTQRHGIRVRKAPALDRHGSPNHHT